MKQLSLLIAILLVAGVSHAQEQGSIGRVELKLLTLGVAGAEIAYLKPDGQSWVSERLAQKCSASRVRRNMHAMVYHGSKKATQYLNKCLLRVKLESSPYYPFSFTIQ